MSYDLKPLYEGCQQLGITLTDEQENQFVQYYEYLIEKNKVMNLTGITELKDVLQKHFVDSLAITKAVSLDQIVDMIDIGTGAGFPGMPLKIVYPHLNTTLLDSLNKRIQFLKDLSEMIHVDHIEFLHGRAEDYAKMPEYRQQFNLCVSRAVANLSTLTEYCLPYVKVGGLFISYKSGNIDEELDNSKKAIHLLGGKLKEVVKFTLPDTDIDRSLVIIEKITNTSNKYPRKSGQPSKNPL